MERTFGDPRSFVQAWTVASGFLAGFRCVATSSAGKKDARGAFWEKDSDPSSCLHHLHGPGSIQVFGGRLHALESACHRGTSPTLRNLLLRVHPFQSIRQRWEKHFGTFALASFRVQVSCHRFAIARSELLRFYGRSNSSFSNRILSCVLPTFAPHFRPCFDAAALGHTLCVDPDLRASLGRRRGRGWEAVKRCVASCRRQHFE